MTSDTSEKGFQQDIIDYLTSTGYVKRTTNNYDTASCLDIDLVLKFIKTTQPDEWNKFANVNKTNTEGKFKSSLVKQIQKQGTIEVLRNGFRDIGKFKLFYTKPNNQRNDKHMAKFNQNIFSVIDELEYENKEHNFSCDWSVCN